MDEGPLGRHTSLTQSLRQGDVRLSPLWSAAPDMECPQVALTFIGTELGAVEPMVPVRQVLLLVAWHAKSHKTKHCNAVSRWQFLCLSMRVSHS